MTRLVTVEVFIKQDGIRIGGGGVQVDLDDVTLVAANAGSLARLVFDQADGNYLYGMRSTTVDVDL